MKNRYLSKTFTFKVKVTNDPPFFTSDPQSTLSIEWFQSIKYVLPTVKDDEGHPITVTSVEQSKSLLPRFMTFDKSTLTYDMDPIATDTLGNYTIQVTLSDTMGASKTYTFDVVVFAAS
jgi:hypothetical protein